MTPRNLQTQAGSLDQYYTRPETAALCMAHLHAVLPNLSADLYLEPSAGDGAFLSLLPTPRLGLDIAPAADGIDTADFLEWAPEDGAGRIVVVGNPPFGHAAAKAITFFNHASGFADVIAMILPASLQKASMQARLDRRYHLVSEMPVPAEPFRHGEALTQVNVVFQVWERRDYERALPISATSHEDFVFVGALEEAHFVVRRVGARAGAILPVPAKAEVPRGYATASNLFIRATGDPALLEARFRCLDVGEVRERVAAVPSVSKSDLVALYSAQRALDMARATAPDQVPVTSYVASAAAGIATGLVALEDAQNRDLVAMIVSRYPAGASDAPASTDVTFRRRDESGFTAVLRGALRGKQRRCADRLLDDLFRRQVPWARSSGTDSQVTVLFQDAILRVDHPGDDRRQFVSFALRETGESEAALLPRASICMALGRLWLGEMGVLDVSSKAAPMTDLPNVIDSLSSA